LDEIEYGISLYSFGQKENLGIDDTPNVYVLQGIIASGKREL
jgi:hypothetical protein